MWCVYFIRQWRKGGGEGGSLMWKRIYLHEIAIASITVTQKKRTQKYLVHGDPTSLFIDSGPAAVIQVLVPRTGSWPRSGTRIRIQSCAEPEQMSLEIMAILIHIYYIYIYEQIWRQLAFNEIIDSIFKGSFS